MSVGQLLILAEVALNEGRFNDAKVFLRGALKTMRVTGDNRARVIVKTALYHVGRIT